MMIAIQTWLKEDRCQIRVKQVLLSLMFGLHFRIFLKINHFIDL